MSLNSVSIIPEEGCVQSSLAHLTHDGLVRFRRPKAPPEELLGLDDNRGDYTFDDTYDEDEEDDQAFFSD